MPTAGYGVVVTIHCNNCGHVFETVEHHLRFCSIGCASRFWAPTRRYRPTAVYAPAQAALLDCLRSRPGEWVAVRDIVQSVYGLDDPSTRHCLTMTLYRLRGTWAGDGLVIASRKERPRLYRHSATYYRLEHDIETDAQEVAS